MKIRSLVFLAFIMALVGMVTACKDPNSSDSPQGDSSVVVTGTTLAIKLEWLVSNAASNTNYLLEVHDDELLNSQTLSYSGKSNITIQLTGIGDVKTVEIYGSGSLFTIGSGVTLALNKNIALKGKTNNTAPLITVNGGNLILNNGSKMSGNSVSSSGNTSPSGGGGVYVDSGTFTMNGGEISGNTSASSGGGGVYVGGGIFTMNGGEISGNTTSYPTNSGGGGVYVGGGTFTMKGGKISGNTSGSNSSYYSYSGGGVYVGGGTFAMTGGEISGNTASSSGGGVYIGAVDKSKFEKTGGIITGYSSDMENGNRAYYNRGNAVYAQHSDSRFIRYKESTSGLQNNLTYVRDEPKPPTISGAWDYTVNFYSDGGYPYPDQQYIAHGSKVIEPPAMSKTGYTFGGWYKEDGFINLWNFNIDTVTENITLYAQWIIVPIPNAPDMPVIIPSNGSLTVQWTAVEYAAYYDIYFSQSTTIPASPQFYNDTETSRTITSLVNGNTYYVWIKARNTTGTSEPSPMASGEPMGDMGEVTLVSSNGQLVLNWSAVAGAAQYEVYYHTSYSIPATPAQTVSATTATVSGLTNGTTYYVWVKPKNTHGTGNASAAASGKPIGNMGAVTLTPGESGQLVLSWSAVAGADQYEVYHGTTTTIPASPTQPVTATTTTISSLNNGTTYYVWVKPKNAIGVGDTSTVKSGVPIATPGNLTLNAAYQQITVSWTAVSGASSYQVYYSTNTTIPASPSYTGTELSRTFTGLTNGTTYYFWVKAVNDNGAGAATMANGKPIGNMGTVTVTPGGSSQLVLSWSAVAGADEYEVYHSTTNTIPGSPTQPLTTTTATINSLTNGTTYYVWVKPKNVNGSGGTSTVVSGVPIATPDNLTLNASNQQITVSWVAVFGANSYEVYYSTNTTIPASPSHTGTELSRTFNDLTNGTTYHFWVKAVNISGASVASTMVSGKPIGNMGTVSLVSGNSQFVLSWSAIAGADQYEVYHNTSNSIPSSPTQTVSSTTTATISGLTNGTPYYVWVKPKNANGTGNASTFVYGSPLGTPGAPTVSPAYKQLLVTWTAVPGATGYEVYYGMDITPTTLATTVTGNAAIIVGLTNGTTYYVRLRARNNTGISDYGPTASNSPIPISVTSGLYRGTEKIGNQNLSASLSYISSNSVSGDAFYIVLGANETASPMNLIYPNKAVSIMLIGYGGERTITLTSNGSLFTIPVSNANVNLTLDENITLVGLSTNNSPLVTLNSGKLVINAGAKISGNNNPTGTGGGIYVGGGTFTINGGEIRGNTARGGGIFVGSGTVVMNGGTISGNRSNNQGGGVEVSGGTFTMHGGVISGNTASNYGGDIYVNTSATFKKLPNGGGQNSGIIYGSEETGVDADGAPLRNTPSAVSSSKSRNTTAGQTDQIDTTTDRGLSANGNPPFGQ